MRPPNPGFIDVVTEHLRNYGMRSTMEAFWMATIHMSGDAPDVGTTDAWMFVAERLAWFRDTFALRTIDRLTGKDR